MFPKNRMRLVLVGIITITAILLVSATAAVLTSSRSLASNGALSQVQTTVSITVYADSACTQTATSIDWGNLGAGATVSRTLYIKNTGNAPVMLSLSTNGWTPIRTQQYLTLSWNLDGRTLAINEQVQANLQVAASESVDTGITNFGFNVVITGTG